MSGSSLPGRYPVVVVGSGPAGLQLSYCLDRLGVDHAVVSADDEPGGMFRHYPVFQRLVTWTKPHAPVAPDTARFERYDWNSLLADDPVHRFLVRAGMGGDSYFPTRAEMEAGMAAFAARTDRRVRYRTVWHATRQVADGFVLTTSAGDYHGRVVVFAVGVAQPWRPPIEGLADLPHYVDVRSPASYTDRRVLLIGKRNSGFELADGLLTHARQIILVSPRPARLSVVTHSTAAARARYLQPYEDHALGGGVVVLDAAIDRAERHGDGHRVHVRGTTTPFELALDVDDVIVATGFATPLGDLPDLGVATFYRRRLPALTPWWESATVPGVYFAGAATQGAVGMKKYGVPSNSAAVHGFRYNARVLARHIAERHFDIRPPDTTIDPDAVVPGLLAAATHDPALWNQQSYLARAVTVSPERGILAGGLVPLTHFVDETGPDAAAVTVETDAGGTIRPALYVRRDGAVTEHVLPGHPLHDFASEAHLREATAATAGLLR